jgi:glycosyltransferase involved in cell wall biosynthesis
MKIVFIWPHLLENIANIGVSKEFYKYHRSFEHRYAYKFKLKGHNVSVIYLSSSIKEVEEGYHILGHKMIGVPISNFKYLRMIKAATIISTLNDVKTADIIHVYNYYSNLYDILSLLFYVRGINFIAQAQASPTYKLPLRVILRKRFTLHLANKLVPLTIEEEEKLNRLFYIPPNKIVRIPNGVDITWFKPIPITEVRRKLKCKEEGYYIVSVARLIPEKGIDILFHAISLIAKKIENLHVIIIGEGKEKNKLKLLAKALNIENIVEFKSFIPNENLPLWYNIADIVVIPSRVETGCLIVPLEAMACGKPIIGSDLEGIRASVKHGYNGLLFTPEDSIALAKAMMKLLKNNELRSKMGENARKMVVEKFDETKIIENMIKLYKEVLSYT